MEATTTHSHTFNSGHGEYTVYDVDGLQATGPSFDPYDIAYDPEAGEQAEQDAVRAAYEAEGFTVPAGADLTWEYLVRWTGTLEAFEAGYRQLLATISTTPSGDDDTFDYWPSAVRYTRQVAAYLDSQDGGTRVHAVDTIARTTILGELEEFADDLMGKVGLEMPAGPVYVRVVLAVQPADLARFQEYLDCFIETEAIPGEFAAREDTSNPVQGAYVSAPYASRQVALGADWRDRD